MTDCDGVIGRRRMKVTCADCGRRSSFVCSILKLGMLWSFANPALTAAEWKKRSRHSVASMIEEVNLLCAPPSMLCELSYGAAQKEDFCYYRVEPGT